MANPQNLKPNTERTPEEQSALGRKAGIASGKARRERKTIREIVRAVLDEQMPGTDMTRGQAIVVRTLKRAYDGGKVRDLRYLAEIAGELDQQINLNATTTQVIVSSPETAAHLANLRKGKK